MHKKSGPTQPASSSVAVLAHFEEQLRPVARRAANHKLKSMARKIDISGTSESINRIFLLSPAYAGGERARMIMSDRAQFDLARRLRGKQGATIAEVFTFLSGLYFRGKIAYANAFARPLPKISGVLVITPTRGLVDAQTIITLKDLREFAEVDIDQDDPRYRKPLERDVRRLAKNYQRATTWCYSAASPPENMSMFCSQIFANVCVSRRFRWARRHESRWLASSLRGGSTGT